MKIDELTSSEFKRAVDRASVAILPIGAVEEHGPHLPLSTDSIQPMHVAEMVARKTGAFVAPLLPYGVCTATRDFPGTLSVSFEALRFMVRDVLSELVRNGFRSIVVLSGHAGREHMSALRLAARDVLAETPIRIAVLSDYDIIYDMNKLPPEDGHAGMGETSRIMAERPRLVKGRPHATDNTMPRYAVLPDSRPYWPGVTGDPSKATAKLGRDLDVFVASELVKIVRGMKDWRVKG